MNEAGDPQFTSRFEQVPMFRSHSFRRRTGAHRCCDLHGIGGKMDDGAAITHRRFDPSGIANISFDEQVRRIVGDAGQIFQVARA